MTASSPSDNTGTDAGTSAGTSADAAPIAFNDLAAQRARLGPAIDKAISNVLTHGRFISGPEVSALEEEIARYTGAKHCVSCANGTDALVLVLRALGVGPGDAVLVPTYTFVATAEAVAIVGATPVFCDVGEDTFNLDPGSLGAGVEAARQHGLEPKAVIAVDLFGQLADYRRIQPQAAQLGLSVIADSAQSFGAALDNRRSGNFALATTFSFFPAKPLGCYGDGGAIVTDDPDLAASLRSICVHGKGRDKYDNIRIGTNSRLDTLQAAILLEKLKIFEDEVSLRNEIASRYSSALDEVAVVPSVIDGAVSVWAQYTIRLSSRDDIAARLAQAGIPTAIYYRSPIHRQSAYRHFPRASSTLEISERLADAVLSLPMHPYLDNQTQQRIISAVRKTVAAAGR